jgi:hypothetical protein
MAAIREAKSGFALSLMTGRRLLPPLAGAHSPDFASCPPETRRTVGAVGNDVPQPPLVVSDGEIGGSI